MNKHSLTIWLDEELYKKFKVKSVLLGKSFKDILTPFIKKITNQ